MIRTYLTKGGNILLLNSKGKFSFHNPELEFIREVSESEGEYILSKHPVEIEILRNDAEWDMHCAGVQPLPVWYFITSIQVVQDNCNNDGNYSRETYHDWYVAKYPNGEWKFAFVERHFTSAEFSYTELGGYLDSNPGNCYITNVEGNKTYTMGCSSHDEVLEKIATMSSFKDMWNEEYEYIPSRWDEGDEATVIIGLSFSDKKAIITRLKELGVTKQDSKPSLRSHRKGGKGERR